MLLDNKPVINPAVHGHIFLHVRLIFFLLQEYTTHHYSKTAHGDPNCSNR